MRYLNRTLVLALLALAGLQAQDITRGSITGVVHDATGAVVPGAPVKLTSPFGDRQTTSNSGGAYSFTGLTVGTGYSITVNQPGFSAATQRGIAVGINATTTADINLEVGTATQSVDVTADTTAIDLSTTNIGANIDESLFRNVPIGRNISAVMAMAPGVSDSVGAGSANPSINGASGLENEYIVNGANTTDPGFGGFGTYSRAYGPLGNGINFDFVQEVQVQTGGFEAQYGQALGGIINVVTKSGTNKYHGDVYGYFQPEQFEANRTDANPLLTSKFDYLVHQGSLDYGGDFGGYILKDKLFFYGGINPLHNTNYKEADPFYANNALGVIARTIRTIDYTGKINYNLGTKHQFEGSVFGDPSNTPMTFNQPVSTVPAPGPVDRSVESKLNFGTRTWTGRYNGTLTPNWALTVNYSNYYNSFTNTPLENGYEIIDETAAQAGTGGQISYGGVGFNELSESKVNQMAVSSTHIFRLWGGHTITYGYQFEDDQYNDAYGLYTGANFQFPNVPALGAAAGQTSYGGQFLRTHENPNDPSTPIVLEYERGLYSPPYTSTDGRYQGGYFQDSWTFGRFTIKPGVRFEQQSLIGNLTHYDLTHNWAPRVGVILDPFNDHKTKIDASWGRFFEKVPSDISVRALSSQLSITGAWYTDPGPGAQPNLSPSNYVPGGNIAFQGGPQNLEFVAAGTGAQFQDEVTAGYEHEFAHNLTFTGRFVYRDLRRIIEDMSGTNVTQALHGVPQIYVVGNPSAKLDIFQNVSPCTSGPNCNTSTGYTNFANGSPNGSDGIPDGFPNPSRIYKSMELIMNKRFSNVQFYGSYVLSKLYGNFQGSFRSDNGQQDPNISSMFDFTNSDGVLTGQDIPGVLNSDRRHQFKLFGNYVWHNFNVGASWLPTSGTPITNFLAHPAYLNAGEIPVCPDGTFTCAGGPRGAYGRTAWTFDVNLHGDYTIKLGERARVKFVADLFNLFDEQKVIRVNQWSQLNGGGTNPDFLKPGLEQFQDPYEVPFNARLAVRFEF
jgi:hypothetical protein